MPCCNVEGCSRRGVYNYPDKRDGLYCIHHCQSDMVNVCRRRCTVPECTGYARFGFGMPMVCRKHIEKGMVDLHRPLRRICVTDICCNPAVYNEAGASCAWYCKEHATSGMVEIRIKEYYPAYNATEVGLW